MKNKDESYFCAESDLEDADDKIKDAVGIEVALVEGSKDNVNDDGDDYYDGGDDDDDDDDGDEKKDTMDVTIAALTMMMLIMLAVIVQTFTK